MKLTIQPHAMTCYDVRFIDVDAEKERKKYEKNPLRLVFVFFVLLVCRTRCCLGVCTLTCRFQRETSSTKSQNVLFNDLKNENCGAKRTTKLTRHYNFFCQSRKSAGPSRLLRCAWLCIEGLPFLSLFAFPCLATGNVIELVQLAFVCRLSVCPIHPVGPCVCRWLH